MSEWATVATNGYHPLSVSPSENKILLPVSPNSEVIKISWPCEKPPLLFPPLSPANILGYLHGRVAVPPAPLHGPLAPFAPQVAFHPHCRDAFTTPAGRVKLSCL